MEVNKNPSYKWILDESFSEWGKERGQKLDGRDFAFEREEWGFSERDLAEGLWAWWIV